MALTLHFHPLSSFCQKVLIALYEHAAPFDTRLIDLMDPVPSAAFRELWPIGKMPVLVDSARGRMLPETSVIIEYLDQHYRGAQRLIPSNPELALDVRLYDRFFDLYVNVPVGKIVFDRLRPSAESDPRGVREAKALLETAYALAERRLEGKAWVVGDTFSMADCAAAPALFYAERLVPFGGRYPNLGAYARRLYERPSYARALREAEPYLRHFPG